MTAPQSFLEHEVAFHQAVIDALHTTLLPGIKNEELKALVVKVAPAFQAHMLAAQQLEKQLEKQSARNSAAITRSQRAVGGHQ